MAQPMVFFPPLEIVLEQRTQTHTQQDEIMSRQEAPALNDHFRIKWGFVLFSPFLKREEMGIKALRGKLNSRT